MDRLFFILVLASLSILFLLFFPIYLETSVHYDMNGRKLSFQVNLYKIIQVFGGYIATYSGGFALHTSQKKAIIIPYMEMNNERKRFSAIRTLRMKSFHFTVETGASYLLPVLFFQKIAEIYFFTKGGRKEGLESN